MFVRLICSSRKRMLKPHQQLHNKYTKQNNFWIGCDFAFLEKVEPHRNASLRPMKFLPPSRRRAAGRWLTAACATLSISLAVACASPGPPRPPSLRLPVLVKDLTAQRVGDEVQLHWTTPTKTTDDLPVKGPLTAEICRGPAPSTPPSASSVSSACIPVKRVPVQPGPSQAADPLPRPLTLDPVALLAYRVQILNANQRSAGQSPEAFAAAGAAPPPVEDLHATPVREGAMLEWRRQPTAASVELDRFLEGAPPTPTKTARPKPTSKPNPRPANPSPTTKASQTPSQPKPSPPPEVKLKTPQQASDPGGTIDHAAQFGETYRYTAQRVRTATFPGHSLELRSAASPPVVVALKDTFPPHPPTGLAAVPNQATSTADHAPSDHASIDLSWEPNTDPDLAGYIVYRQPVDATGALAGPAIRLNPTPLPGPAYRDETAVVGQTFAYRVTAIDTVGNESAPSADVQERLREQ